MILIGKTHSDLTAVFMQKNGARMVKPKQGRNGHLELNINIQSNIAVYVENHLVSKGAIIQIRLAFFYVFSCGFQF